MTRPKPAADHPESDWFPNQGTAIPPEPPGAPTHGTPEYLKAMEQVAKENRANGVSKLLEDLQDLMDESAST